MANKTYPIDFKRDTASLVIYQVYDMEYGDHENQGQAFDIGPTKRTKGNAPILTTTRLR